MTFLALVKNVAMTETDANSDICDASSIMIVDS